MEEIIPGVFHWSAFHPGIRQQVSSYYLHQERVLIDPMVPDEGLDWFDGQGPPTDILLTNRHHYRHSGEFADRFDCTVRCVRSGMHEFTRGEVVEPFEFGDELAGGLVAHEVGAICPDESALHVPARAALACADGVINYDGLRFVPDNLMDDPEDTKTGLRLAYRRLGELDFDHLLLAHGPPVVGGGQEALRRFAEK